MDDGEEEGARQDQDFGEALDVADVPQVRERIAELARSVALDGCLLAPELSGVTMRGGVVRVTVSRDESTIIGPGTGLLRLLRLLDIISGAVVAGRTLTPRDVFYLQKGAPDAWRTPDGVNEGLRVLQRVLRVPRHCLGVVAPTRGLFAGPITVETRHMDGQVLVDHGWPHQAPIRAQVLRPNGARLLLPRGGIAAVVVVEKEAVFHELVNAGVHERCVLVTGRGVPCLATRAFAKLLGDLQVPILGVFDWNPFGLFILLLFAHGGKRDLEAYRYAVPQLRGVGLLRHDVDRLGAALNDRLQPLTAADVSKARSLLPLYETTQSVDLRAELSYMLASGSKLELEALNQMRGFPSDYLSSVWLPEVLRKQSL